jgi:hypothetical protein
MPVGFNGLAGHHGIEPVSLLRRSFHCSKLLPHVAWCSFSLDRAARHHSMSTQLP